MIPQSNISLLSNRLARQGGRRIPEAVLERDYCLAWLLVGLSQSPLRHRLAFKGGTAMKRCYFGDYRFSEDLDFTLATPTSFETILSELTNIYEKVQRISGVAFRYSRADHKPHQNSHTFYLAYEGPLPGTTRNEVKIDITINERIVFQLQERAVIRGYDEYIDLPENQLVQVYSLEEIAVEKLLALTDRARNEPRDLYDLCYLTSEGNIDLAMLIPEIKSKLEFRSRSLIGIGEEFAKKEARYRKLWNLRLASQMIYLPQFDEIYRAVRRAIREAGLMDKLS